MPGGPSGRAVSCGPQLSAARHQCGELRRVTIHPTSTHQKDAPSSPPIWSISGRLTRKYLILDKKCCQLALHLQHLPTTRPFHADSAAAMGPLAAQPPPSKDRTSQEDDETTLLLGYGEGLRGVGEVHGSDPATPYLRSILANNASLERDLVHRLDLFLMTFGCISQGLLQFPASVPLSNHFISYKVGPFLRDSTNDDMDSLVQISRSDKHQLRLCIRHAGGPPSGWK